MGKAGTGCIEPLQTGAGGVPLFVVHAMGGSPGCYRPMARFLADRSIYGLRSLRPYEFGYPHRSIPDMAEAYTQAVCGVYESGIVHLAGWSLGGLIVFEMARVLRSYGRAVGLVALIDTALHWDHLQITRSASYLESLHRRRWRIFHKLVTGRIGDLDDISHPFWLLNESQKLEFVAKDAVIFNPQRYAVVDGEKRFSADYQAYLLLRSASDNYQPVPQDCNIVFVAAERENNSESLSVWKHLVSGTVTALSCSGSHLTIMSDPNASSVAHILSAQMALIENDHFFGAQRPEHSKSPARG